MHIIPTIVSKNAFFSDSPGSKVILWLIISKNENVLLKIRKKMFPTFPDRKMCNSMSSDFRSIQIKTDKVQNVCNYLIPKIRSSLVL